MKSRWCAAFPGREAVLKGMDDSFYRSYVAARSVFHEADDFFHTSLEKKCYSQDIIEPEWQCICLITHCFAIYKVVSEIYGLPEASIGYSQGEFASGTAAGAFQFPNVLGTIYALEKILSTKVPKDECMYRLIGIKPERLDELCKLEDSTESLVAISAFISDAQNIISGKRETVNRVIQEAKKEGAKWSLDLKAARAYHCNLCAKEADTAQPYFDQMILGTPIFNVYSNYDGEKCIQAEVLRSNLSKQIAHPLQWNKIIHQLANDDINDIIEVGPGCTVSSNIRIINSQLNCRWIGRVDDLW